MLASGSPRFANGEFVGTMAVFTDITARKRAEAALQKARDELEQRVRAHRGTTAVRGLDGRTRGADG